MKIQKLGSKEMILLLTALGYKLNKSKCQFCNKKLEEGKFGILNGTDKKRIATLICDCPLCFCDYLDKMKSKEVK